MELRILNLDQGDALELRDLLSIAGFYPDAKHRSSLDTIDPLVVSLGFSALTVLAAWIVKSRKKTVISLEIEVRKADGSYDRVNFKMNTLASQSKAEVLKALQETISPKIAGTKYQEQGNK